MALNIEKIRAILIELFPTEIVTDFILPNIISAKDLIEATEELLRFNPTNRTDGINIERLAALNWQKMSLPIHQVGVGLELFSMRDQKSHLDRRMVVSYEKQYAATGLLKPPIIWDTMKPRPYIILDGNHRFCALSEAKAVQHDFWVGT